jgi:mutator protein MutT
MPDLLPIAVAVVERDGKFLIGRRADDAVQGGLWEFPGGKIEPRETPAQAARRECLEETGLAVRIGEPYEGEVHDYGERVVQLHFFRATAESSNDEPHPPFRWVAREELGRYEFPVANRQLIELLTQC